ncbi:MAG: amidohydrolase family protein [Myxococcaceae bacterium]
MDGRLVFKDCAVFHADGRVRSRMAVVVSDGLITHVAPDSDVPVLPGDWAVGSRGRMLAPGLVNCHTHLVNAQLVPPSGELLMRTAAARADLQRRLDVLLTPDEVEVLTAYALGRCARSGVTLAIEHLSCPSAVGEGLVAQARAAERIGVRLVNSHATDSLDGEDVAIARADENAAYVRAAGKHPLVRAALGFHSSSTCGDELLRKIGRAKEELGVGAHFHLGESDDDLTTTYALHQRRIVSRMESFGLLGAGTVAAYARGVDRNESDRLSRTRTLMALSPRSMLLVESGLGSFESLLAYQNLVGIGSAGLFSLWEEVFFAFVNILHTSRAGRLIDPDGLMAQLLIGGPAELCSMIFGAHSGVIEEGALADLVLYDAVPPSASTGEVASALMGRLAQAPVAWTVVAGRVVVREGKLLGTDELELAARTAEILDSLWARASLHAKEQVAS